jgi:hypothetical protein
VRHFVGLLFLALVGSAHGQISPPTELEDCVGPEADFCFSGSPALIDTSCGVTFNGYQGRIAWPALRNVGPVTIAVQTRNMSFQGQTFFPLYVEIVARPLPEDGTDCNHGRAGQVVLTAEGARQCGGTWSSIGPLDLRPFGVPLGVNYSVQCTFFRTSDGVTPRTVGFSCIRVTPASTVVGGALWGSVKRLYGDSK